MNKQEINEFIEKMKEVGDVLNENQELSELGKSYLKELRKYAPANP